MTVATRASVVSLAAALTLLPLAGAAWAGADAGDRGHGDRARISTTVLDVPPGFDSAEPHLAVAPDDPDRLYAVATVTGEQLGLGLVWRTADGGRTWKRSPLIGGTGATPLGFDADPVLAAGRKGLLLYTSLALDVDEVTETAPLHVGTRVSTDRGATFSAYGSADMVTLPLCLFFGCPPPPDLQGLDTPWLAVDTTRGRFKGSSYLVWVHDRADGRHELRFAASRDGGLTYAPPLVLDRTTAEQLDGLEELPHVVVRPDGRVDVTWNAVRDGSPVILHAVSTDGGSSFAAAERVVRLKATGSRLGISTTLAVSPEGRLGLCWAQAGSPDTDDARVTCKMTQRDGRWEAGRRILKKSDDRQYLPAAAFEGEALWVAAYVSNEKSTRLVAVRSQRHGFSDPVTVNRWPVPGSRICAPRPPDCTEEQTFIGDYIGLVATPRRIAAAYIAPSPDASQRNEVLVSSFRPQ